jgi:hypothetical protein
MKQNHPLHRFRDCSRWKLWEAWILATAIGELIGLGIVVWASTQTQTFQKYPEGAFLLVGALEGIILGCCQWLVLRRYVPHIAGWIVATTIGAIVAWMGGSLVSLLMAVSYAWRSDAASAKAFYEGILLLGASLGTILGFAQWIVLRTHIRRASWWIFSSTLAWAIGLLVAFMGADLPQPTWSEPQVALARAATGAMMGIVIGSITGIVLVWLIQPSASKPR